jgi:uncharacterized protein
MEARLQFRPGMSSESLHESADRLSPATQDLHRAIVSLMEELEAVDWYNQRVEAASDTELRAILAHNRDEEKEHAAMVLEWIRRRDPVFEQHLKAYLFSDGSIIRRERAAQAHDNANGDRPQVSVGSLREAR